jgi:hypothetical protein
MSWAVPATARVAAFPSSACQPPPRLPPWTPLSLPDKIAADPEGRLVALAHSDVGILNNVMELWRYPSAAACIRCVGGLRTDACFALPLQLLTGWHAGQGLRGKPIGL